jgi:hypothetical protein
MSWRRLARGFVLTLAATGCIYHPQPPSMEEEIARARYLRITFAVPDTVHIYVSGQTEPTTVVASELTGERLLVSPDSLRIGLRTVRDGRGKSIKVPPDAGVTVARHVGVRVAPHDPYANRFAVFIGLTVLTLSLIVVWAASHLHDNEGT